MNNIYIPSYNRPDLVRTYEYLGCGKIVVPKSQEKDYKKRYGNAVVSIPDEKDGSVNKKRNAIIDLIKEEQKDGFGWTIDDDFICLKRKKENIKLSGDECLEHLERIQIMAKDMGATFSGFDYSEDCMKLKDMAPFSMTKPSFLCVLIDVNDNLRYDERLRTQGDLEFWIAKINQNRFILKDNQYVALAYGEDGGADSVIGYTKKDREISAKFINNKYGLKIIKYNKHNNQRFVIPIKGT